MRALLKRWAPAALILVLVATAQAAAVARAMPGSSGYAVICTGSGPVMVELGENGEPVSRRYCPEGALVLLAALSAPAEPHLHAVAGTRLTLDEARGDIAGVDPAPPRARAPPLPV